MYFWRIKKLKANLIERPLSGREELRYLIGFLLLWVLTLTAPPEEGLNRWDHAGLAVTALLTIVGTIYLFHRNGGAGGELFLQRYFVLGWVVSIRWAAAFVSLYVIVRLIASILDAWPSEETNVFDFLLISAGEVCFYWRLGVHIADVSRGATTLRA